MSETSLYLKHRPQSLDEVLGNNNVVDIIRKQVAATMPQSVLLHGPTGCGKTTLGRIIAKELGARGGDLREVDSADFRGIDTIRDIRKQSRFKPLEGTCKVWILDEVHRLTGDAQSALLKILEDTPPHVYFILCTTDPQKLLPTIKGRCSQLQVSPLSDREMKILLRRVVKAEGESIPREVYDQITQDSLGHPRNALQILNQVLAVEEDKRLATAKQTAELQSQTIELCRALTQHAPWQKVSGILSGLKEQEPEGIRRAVLGYCQAVLLKSGDASAAAVMEEFTEPFFNSGFAGLVLACYAVIYAE